MVVDFSICSGFIHTHKIKDLERDKKLNGKYDDKVDEDGKVEES